MANRPWLDELRSELVRRALPPGYVERFVQELADHLQDLTEDTMSTEARLEAHCLESRLGKPEDVAHAATAEYRRRRLLEQRPWLALATFVLLPIPSLLLLWAAMVLAMVFVAERAGVDQYARSYSGQSTIFGAPLIDLAVAATLVIPLVALAVFYGRLARRTANHRRWAMIACAILAVVGAVATHNVVLSEVPGRSSLTFGLGFGWGILSGWQMVQCALPLLIGLLVSARRAPSPA